MIHINVILKDDPWHFSTGLYHFCQVPLNDLVYLSYLSVCKLFILFFINLSVINLSFYPIFAVKIA